MLTQTDNLSFIRKIEHYYNEKDYEVYCFEIRDDSISIWIKATNSTERFCIEYEVMHCENGENEYYCNYMKDLIDEDKKAVMIY